MEEITKKRQRSEVETADLCIQKIQNGKQCSFKHLSNSKFCKRHNKVNTVDHSMNTENISEYDDIHTANNTILNLLNEMEDLRNHIEKLRLENSILKDKIIDKFMNS